MHRGQLRVPERGNLGGLDQDGLEMFVALLGDRAPMLLAGGLPLCAAQAAVTDSLPNGTKSRKGSPISKTQVSAVTSPTPAMVIKR